MDWPPKVPKNFPLTVHSRGYVRKDVGWICGKKTPEEALRLYHEKAAKLLAEPVPVKVKPVTGDRQTVDQLAARYLHVRRQDAEGGKLKASTLHRIETALAEFCEHQCGEFDGEAAGDILGETTIDALKPDHFASYGMAAQRDSGPTGGSDKCKLIAALFNFADGEDWIERPVKFGKRFRSIAWGKQDAYKSVPPTPEQCRKLLKWIDDRLAKQASTPAKRRKNLVGPAPLRQFKAMVLLALNGGYGSTELAELPRDVLDIDGGAIDYRRGKTKQKHLVPLWPETIAALQLVIADADRLRPNDELLFRTREGKPWAYQKKSVREDGTEFFSFVDNCAQWFSKVARPCKIKVKGQSFYSLKDLHATLGDESGDTAASYALTGHSIHSKGRDPYVTVSRERLQRVVDFIRHRLWPPEVSAGESAGASIRTRATRKRPPASKA